MINKIKSWIRQYRYLCLAVLLLALIILPNLGFKKAQIRFQGDAHKKVLNQTMIWVSV